MNELYRIIVSLSEKSLEGMMKKGLKIQSESDSVHLETRFDGVEELASPSIGSFTRLKALLMMFPKLHLVATNYPISEVNDKIRFGYKGSEEDRVKILQFCADEFSKTNSINYITMELDNFVQLKRDPTRAFVIAAKHFFGKYSSSDLVRSIEEMKRLTITGRADVAKVAALTENVEEIKDFREITNRYSRHVPLIAVPMGSYDFVKDARIRSLYEDRVFATFARPTSGEAAAPGQPSVDEIRNFRLK